MDLKPPNEYLFIHISSSMVPFHFRYSGARYISWRAGDLLIPCRDLVMFPLRSAHVSFKIRSDSAQTAPRRQTSPRGDGDAHHTWPSEENRRARVECGAQGMCVRWSSSRAARAEIHSVSGG